MVLIGSHSTTPTDDPTIIPELQNISVTSVIYGRKNFGALTSSGELLTWGHYGNGSLGLGDPGKLPAGSQGGYAKEKQRVQAKANKPPPDVAVPSKVRFDHGLRAEGRVKRYCFAVAAGQFHKVALVVDLTGGGVPQEDLEQYFETAAQWNTQDVHSQKFCCFM